MAISQFSGFQRLLCPFFFNLRRDCLYFLRSDWKLSSFTILYLNIHAERTKQAKQWIIAMETDTQKVSLAGMRAFNNVVNTLAKWMQHFCSHLRTKEMLDDVEDDVWWKSNFIQYRATCCPNACNMVDSTMLDDVASTCWISLARALGPNNKSSYSEANVTCCYYLFQCNAIACTCVSEDRRWIATADSGKDSMVIIWDSFTT